MDYGPSARNNPSHNCYGPKPSGIPAAAKIPCICVQPSRRANSGSLLACLGAVILLGRGVLESEPQDLKELAAKIATLLSEYMKAAK